MKYSVESQSDIGHYFLQREHADGHVETIARIGVANDALRIARLLNAGEAALAVLKKNEWWKDEELGNDWCIECGAQEIHGHEPDCDWAAALAAWKEATK